MKLLSVSETKKLTKKAEPFENLLFSLEQTQREGLYNLSFTLQGWYHSHGLLANVGIRKHWKKLSSLFQHKPLYYATYEHRTAVWGFEWAGQKFIFSKSLRGIEVKILPDFPVEKLESLLFTLVDLLVKGWVRRDI